MLKQGCLRQRFLLLLSYDRDQWLFNAAVHCQALHFKLLSKMVLGFFIFESSYSCLEEES